MSVNIANPTELQRSRGGARSIDATGACSSSSPRHHTPPSPPGEPSRRDAPSERSGSMAGLPSSEGAWFMPRGEHTRIPAGGVRLDMTTFMKDAR